MTELGKWKKIIMLIILFKVRFEIFPLVKKLVLAYYLLSPNHKHVASKEGMVQSSASQAEHVKAANAGKIVWVLLFLSIF